MLSQLSALRRTHRLAALGLAALLLLTAALASAPAQAAPRTQGVFPGTIKWDKEPQIVSNGKRSGFPRVAVDSNNVTHVIYATENGAIMYTNNAGGVFNLGGKALANSSYADTPNVAIAAGPGNVIHAIYARPGNNFRVNYRISFDGGQNWSDPVTISDHKGWNPDIAIDPATGDAHMVWIDNRCGEYNVYYRVRVAATGRFSGTLAPKSECGTYQNRPAITFAGGRPHVVFYRSGEINYTRLEGSSWSKAVAISKTPTTSQNPTIASDGGNNLYVAWDENTNGHDIRFTASFDGGNNWAEWRAISQSKGWASHPKATWSPAAKRFHVVWSDVTNSDDGLEEIWEQQFDPDSKRTTEPDQVSHFRGHSFWPAIGVGTQRGDIVWHDNVEETYQIWDWGGTVVGGGPTTGCDGTLTLGGEFIDGIKVTRSITLTGTIAPEANCEPDQMQIAVNEPITDATPKIPYSATLPPLQAQEGACIQTVSVRLFRNGHGNPAFSASVVVDTQVDAVANATNPHLLGMPAFPGTSRPGASHGDPGYTRESKFLLNVSDIGDCTGVTTWEIPGVGSGTLTDGNYRDWLDLPNITTAGTKQFVVNINDKAGYRMALNKSLVYDPNPPVLHVTSNTTATAPLSTTSILVPLTFDGIDVTDDQYGPNEGLPDHAEFWGVLVANSTTNLTPDNPGLKWFPVQVPDAGSSFTINWDLLSGLTSRPAQNTGGDIYVYVRFIDGAGNPTDDAIAVRRIRLEPDYTFPTLYLPSIGK